MVRLLGGPVRSVRASMGALDGNRRAAGHCAAFLDFEHDAAASIVFSAYDFFDSDELHHWIAEGGAKKEPDRHGKTREAFLARAGDVEAHQALGFGARVLPTEQPYLPHFGLIVATCERGDLRFSPSGVLVHGIHGTREVAVSRGPGRPGQGDALDALWGAVREGHRCLHDARWGRATVEIILAILQSSKSHREVRLSPTGPAPG
jgi:phthalate 4,5-cis-dihydrodiol dehydrogenase